MLDKLPPQNLDAERSVLGSLILQNDAIDEISLTSDEFYSLANQLVFGVFRILRAAGRPADSVTVVEELIRRGELADVGGVEYVMELMEAVPHAAHVRHYAGIVRAKSQQRKLIYACTASIAAAYRGESDEVIAELESSLLAIREAATSGEIITMGDAVDALEQREQNPSSVHPTGLIDVDNHIRGGLRAGQLTIVGGRPGSGKSVFAGQIAKSFADRGEPALVVSLEMDRAELAERYDKSVDRRTLRGLPIYMVDSAYEVSRICSLIRLAKRKHGIQLAVLDYLQLTESDDKKASRERQVADVSRAMKRLAGELKIPIVAACQLNRSGEKENRGPRLSDLRESGSIEQDADIVIMLHHEGVQSQAVIAKQRNGSTGVVPLTFRGELFRFENYAADVPFFGSDE